MSTVNEIRDNFEQEQKDWVEQKKAAIDLIAASGKLRYANSVELVFFRRSLVDRNVASILNLHKYAESVREKSFTIAETAKVAEALLDLDLPPSKLDIGKLTSEWVDSGKSDSELQAFLSGQLAGILNSNGQGNIQPQDVVLYGFGRIGRLAARELMRQAGNGQQLRLRAIVTRGDVASTIDKRAALLRNDSVHGKFRGTVEIDRENPALIINGQRVLMLSANSPSEVDYEQYGIKEALVIDNTGVWKDREGLGLHLQAKGASKVLLTAPAKGDIPNVVFGVNQEQYNIDEENIWSAASCTTNAIVPVLHVMESAYGIEKGHIESVHAYTNDQNLLDNFHKKPRRGRSAAINMVITSTGAGTAVAKVIPSLDGKLTANAVRVPTPNGSLAIMNVTLKKETTVDEINNTIREAALGDLNRQIKYEIDEELVSNDIIGMSCCSIFDSNATIVSEDGKNVVLYAWYDNEYGYTRQVIRFAKHLMKVRRLRYY